jgi:hypothetical protein
MSSAVTLLNPAALAADPRDPVINEYVANHTGTDTHEFVEIFGEPDTDYSAFTLLEIEGDGSGAGVVDGVFPVGATDGSGYWTTGFLNNMIENGSITLMLVENFTGNAGDDLDTDNDGVLDSTPYTRVVDDVAVDEGGSDRVYSAVNLTPGFDGRSYEPGGASRIPNGSDTDAVADWTRNNFDGAGLPGFVATPTGGEALNTPGAPNQMPGNPVINEFVANHTGGDTHEFVEVFGAPNTDYSDFWVLQIEGDVTSSLGRVDRAFRVGTTDADGYWLTGFMSNGLENGAITLLLVERFTGVTGTDIDTDNDGGQDVFPYLGVVDAVGVADGTANDVTYTTVTLTPGFDGVAFLPGGASRIPNGADTDAVSDWLRNDFDGEGLPGFVGTKDAGEALNTPGTKNLPAVDIFPPAVMVDVDQPVLWPPNHKMVEICATVTVVDETDDALTYWLESVVSTEPDNGIGDGNTINDVQGEDDGGEDVKFSVRSERSGRGNGREYIVTYGAQDTAGNIGYGCVAVRVPHDHSGFAMAALGFVNDGTTFANGSDVFALVIPSRPGDSDGDATQIDPRHVYVGNTDAALRPVTSRHVDVNGDGAKDLAVYYNIDDLAAIKTGTPGQLPIEKKGAELASGPIGLHYESGDGTEYSVPDIFNLGDVVEIPFLDDCTRPKREGRDTPTVESLTSIHPNPFNPSTTITFELKLQEHVSLRVYNVNGQLVRTLANAVTGVGSHVVRWNGMDDRGRQTASGVYFIKLESPSFSVTRKVIMLK